MKFLLLLLMMSILTKTIFSSSKNIPLQGMHIEIEVLVYETDDTHPPSLNFISILDSISPFNIKPHIFIQRYFLKIYKTNTLISLLRSSIGKSYLPLGPPTDSFYA